MKKHLSVAIFFLCALSANAQNKNIKKIGENSYRTSIFSDTFRFEKVANTTGKNDDTWYWAACLEMVLDYNGLGVTQEQIVNLGLGPDNQPGGPTDLMIAMNRATPAGWGKSSHMVCEAVNIDEDVLFDELSANRPLIAGMRTSGGGNKAVVVVALNYSIKFNAAGEQTGINPTTVIVRDPGVTAQSIQIINWSDFTSNTTILYSLKITSK